MEWNIWAFVAFLCVISLAFTEAQIGYGWGDWSEYTDCSRTCGGGIQQTQRRCENGRSCQGHSTFYRSCNTQECPEHSVDFRTAQCKSFNGVRIEVQGTTRRHSWRPHFDMLTTIIEEDPSAPCALICQNEQGHVKRLRNSVVDGTHCDNGKAFGLCISGVCKPVGCDHRLGSFINEDKCLQCGGTGDRCRTVSGNTMGKWLNSGKRTVVATIPEGAMSLKIKLMSTSPSSLELVSDEGKILRLTEATVSFGAHKVAAFYGTLFTYSMKDDAMQFAARGPTNDTTKLVVRFRGLSPLVEYEYSQKEDERGDHGRNEGQEERPIEDDRYKWIHGDWTDCSVECGPGYQLRAISCVDKQKGKRVGPRMCPHALMPRRNQTCNLGRCENLVTQAYKWIPGHWDECSVECGVGVQIQMMHCVETGTTGQSIYADEDLCTRYAGKKPVYERACRGESMTCGSTTWGTGPWSECSVTCGYGRQTREVYCQRQASSSNDVPVTLRDEDCNEDEMPSYEELCRRRACRDGTNGMGRESSTTEPSQPEDCRRSRFGCCPDGMTKATGDNGYGCPTDEGSTTEADVCEQPDERGSCTNYSIKWYFNYEKKLCQRFWYGGCGGNDNRFDNMEDCRDACLKKKPTKIDCSESRYGCCADGKTHAQGPNKDGCPETNLIGGCAGTRYGCCADGRTAASGSEKLGCPETTLIGGCAGTRHGCCADGRTAARGPERLGCPETTLVGGCAGTRHGCCADGRTAARGPERLGCPETTLVGGCAGTRHGCCADGSTAASGPDKLGCPETVGCAGTRYGCCMDGKTSALGENKKGCPENKRYPYGCAATQYGCCADGTTAARGEEKLGCPENPVVSCDMTEFGCCEDKKTVARGPDGAGCPEKTLGSQREGCEGSRYGCCPDGRSAAGGLNNEGCPAFDSAYCGLDKDPGNCSTYVLKWHFETKYGMCRQFWYGGCGGNPNRYTTKEDCQMKCVNVTGPARCRLPKVTGPCRASKMRYYFNARTGECETFTYGGCKANSNNFLTRGQCEVACNGAISTEPEERPPSACSRNPCRHGFECQDLRDGAYQCGCNPDWGENCGRLPNYWCFSDDECAGGLKCIRQKQCRGEMCYVYARCGVPSSRYACEMALCPSNQDCVNDHSVRGGYICTDKVDYKRSEITVLGCLVSEFGCCPDGQSPAHGPNSYKCSIDCWRSEFGCCPDGRTRATGPDDDGCDILVETSGDVPCEQSDFGCCDDGMRAATGPRGQGCDDTTDSETETTTHTRTDTGTDTRADTGVFSSGKCSADVSRELCTKYEVKWRYDSKLKACERHWWGGCRDNGNVFDTKEECEGECLNVVISEPTEDPDFINICDMPAVTGPCRALIPRYHYDPRDRNCKLFNFGGCGGNENNFRTMEECQQECMADTRQPVTPAPTRQPVTPSPTRSPTQSGETTLTMSGSAEVAEGSELRVTCVTRGPVSLRLEWFYNGRPVTSENVEITYDRKRIPGGVEAVGHLIIERATRENSGTYYCRNSEMQTENMRVTVKSQFEVTTRPTTSKPFEASMTMSGQSVLYQGSQLKIVCKAEGPSDVGLEWFINGQPVTDDSNAEITTDIKRLTGGYQITGQLIIDNVQDTDAGTYYCRSADRQVESMVVNVRRRTGGFTSRPRSTTQAPTPTQEPDGSSSSISMTGDARVPKGGTLTVTCRAIGPRRPASIEWFINGRYVNPRASIATITSVRDPRSLNAIVGSFSIDNANETNDGTYYCRSRPYGDIGRMSIKVIDGLVVTTPAATEPPAETSEKSTPEDICLMPKKIGNCRAALPRFYFDTSTKECLSFLYGGCDGNVNNFATMEACERKCASYLEDKTDVDKDTDEDVCKLYPEKGTCRGYNIKWYYSSSRNRCTRFVYTGCDGNGNRFDTEEECQDRCIRTDVIRPTYRPPFTRRTPSTTTTTSTTTTPSTTTQSNVVPRQYSCTEASDYGPCHVYKIKWYFNTEERRCLRFYYGGCGGNDNRFESRLECENICIRGIEPTEPTTPRPTERPQPNACIYSRYGCCNDGITAAIDRWRSNCEGSTTRPQPNPCVYSRYGCCNDGITSATDRWRSNCPENQEGTRRDSSSVMVTVGNDAILVCSLRNGEISWYRDGFLLRSDSRFEILDNGTLIMRRMSSDMAGNYACRVSYGNNIPQLQRFIVSINEPLTIIPGPALVSVKPGEAAFLHCQAQGNPVPRVSWEKNGRSVRSDASHSVFGNGTLIISQTNFADEGQYVCSAENGVSPTVKRVITLSLKESIEADISAHQGIYMEGDTIRLYCRGEGFPMPTVKWEKEGKMIEGDNRVTISGEELVVRSASIEDAGMYKCVATNEKATASDYTTVQIKLQTPEGKCEDSMRRTKCHLIVTGRLCGFRMFANKCCKSCRKAGYV